MTSDPPFVSDLWEALGGGHDLLDSLRTVGRGELPSAYRVTELATAAIGVAGVAVAELATAIGGRSDDPLPVTVDRGLASAWFGSAIAPVGWAPPPAWDPLARNYRSADGWIRLHTNAPHHRRAALEVLETSGEPEVVADAVARWDAVALESAIVAAGGCAAAMRSTDEWERHPQGSAVAGEPLIDREPGTPGDSGDQWHPTVHRPLAGLRVLDLTRVIAGPVATRFLAGLGADVLRVDPPGWDEAAIVPDMTIGKRSARVDASTPEGFERMSELIAGSDVLVHGYRNGALARLGLPDAQRAKLRPGLVEASLDAYGFSGPWAGRRGFDSLVQMSSGIAEHGMHWAMTDSPTPLPVQALDHTAGYLLAATVLRGVTVRADTGRGSAARTSLARIARQLVAGGPSSVGAAVVDRVAPDIPLRTPWGKATMLRPPVAVEGVAFAFERGPRDLGSDAASWG